MKAIKEFWKLYPAWFYVISSLMFIFFYKTNMPANSYSTSAFIFPFAFFVLFALVEGNEKNNKYYPLILISIVLIIWGTITKLVPPLNFSQETIKVLYEITNISLIILLIIHGIIYLTKKEVIYFFVISLLYGLALESSGIMLGFFSENDFHLYIPLFKAPLVTMLGWTGIFYTTYFIFSNIKKINFKPFQTIIIGAFTISIIALFWDISIDPIASSKFINFWKWNELLPLQPGFLGVPILNFISWFWAVFIYAIGLLHIYKKNYSQPKSYYVLIISVILAQIVSGFFTFATMAIIEGINGPTMTILLHFLKKTF